MNHQELCELVKVAETKFSEVEESVVALTKGIEQYSAENPEFCELFWSKELQKQGEACQKQLKEYNRLMRVSYAAMVKKTELEKYYSQLISDKKFLEGSGVPLVTLLGVLSPEKSATIQKAYFTEIDGKRRDLEKVSSEYDTLKEKLKKEAVDTESFEKATTLRKKRTGSGESIIKGEIKVGNIVTFGRYPRTADSKGHTPIKWRVLEKKEGKALLVSKYGIDCKRYHEKGESITWENCNLRKWLNKEFVQKAFDSYEQGKIRNTSVPADKNPIDSITPRNATTDKVFLLSIPEAEKYFKSDEDRKAAPTAYAKAQRAFTSTEYKTADGKAVCMWWLRSPGFLSNFAAYVDVDGSVDCDGSGVTDAHCCVRPALWINLES